MPEQEFPDELIAAQQAYDAADAAQHEFLAAHPSPSLEWTDADHAELAVLRARLLDAVLDLHHLRDVHGAGGHAAILALRKASRPEPEPEPEPEAEAG